MQSREYSIKLCLKSAQYLFENYFDPTFHALLIFELSVVSGKREPLI